MNYRALGSVAAAAIIAFAQPVAYIAQETNKAIGILSAARKAIGEKKLEALKTFSVQAAFQRNIGERQMNSDVEILLDLPDKYLRQETPQGAGMMIGGGLSGFSGSRSLQKVPAGGATMGGHMVIRMGGSGAPAGDTGAKPTPEQIEQINKTLLRSAQIEASRLMLGWFATAHPAANATYTYAGEAESIDGKAYVIDVKNADTMNIRLLIDQQTNLPLMVTDQGPQPRVMTMGGPAPDDRQVKEMHGQGPAMVDYALYFEEWRDADGVKFPFKMRRAMAGTTTEEWTVTKVKVNPTVDPKRFAGES